MAAEIGSTRLPTSEIPDPVTLSLVGVDLVSPQLARLLLQAMFFATSGILQGAPLPQAPFFNSILMPSLESLLSLPRSLAYEHTHIEPLSSPVANPLAQALTSRLPRSKSG